MADLPELSPADQKLIEHDRAQFEQAVNLPELKVRLAHLVPGVEITHLEVSFHATRHGNTMPSGVNYITLVWFQDEDDDDDDEPQDDPAA